MSNKISKEHSAQDAILGFYFQSLYALLEILRQSHDDAAICLERLDDVEVLSNGKSLLIQLKHSILEKPKPVALSSRALWRTIKAWIDVFPKLTLADTLFQLATVAPLDVESPLWVLTDLKSDRSDLLNLLIKEAERVVEEHSSSVVLHKERIGACIAFLSLDDKLRRLFLSRIIVCASINSIVLISKDIQNCLINFPPDMRPAICTSLLEWWDLQVIFTLCGKRERFIAKIEVQHKISEIAAEIERDELLPDFESLSQPDDHNPDSVLLRQIDIVDGSSSDKKMAIREEWRARSQRHKWCRDRFDMAPRIIKYDSLLLELWSDKHSRLVEDNEECDDNQKKRSGRDLLHWSYDVAHKEVRSFANNWSANYYVRGTYQILAINLQIGWHPEYKKILGVGCGGCA